MSEEKTNVEVRYKSAEWKDMKHVRSGQFETIYANFAQCSFTPWDIRITFSDLAEAEIDKPAIIDLKTITMPPQVAKALIVVLAQNVKEYEKNNGPIKTPAHLASKQEEAGGQVASEGEAKAKPEGEFVPPGYEAVTGASDKPPTK